MFIKQIIKDKDETDVVSSNPLSVLPVLRDSSALRWRSGLAGVRGAGLRCLGCLRALVLTARQGWALDGQRGSGAEETREVM